MRSLDELGYAVSSAATGMAGLAMAVENRPDVVLLDLGLPDLDGRELLAMVRSVNDVPVIVVTARDDDTSVVRLSTPAPTTTWSSRSPRRTSTPGSARCCGVPRPGPRPSPRSPSAGCGSTRVAARSPSTAEPVELTRKEFDLLAYLAAGRATW